MNPIMNPEPGERWLRPPYKAGKEFGSSEGNSQAPADWMDAVSLIPKVHWGIDLAQVSPGAGTGPSTAWFAPEIWIQV